MTCPGCICCCGAGATMPGTATPPKGAVGDDGYTTGCPCCSIGTCCGGICGICGVCPGPPGCVTTCGCGKLLKTGPRGFGVGITTFGAGRSSSSSSTGGCTNCGCGN